VSIVATFGFVLLAPYVYGHIYRSMYGTGYWENVADDEMATAV